MEKEIKVEGENMNKRLDVYLTKTLGEFSRNQIIAAINDGSITVNGKIPKPKYLVRNNDLIKINGLDKLPTSISIQPVKGRLEIIYEDQNLIALNKPAGLSVHPAEQNKEEVTLINYLLDYYPQIKEVGEDQLRPGIVHRLDRETSGVMVVAKNQETFLKLKNIFKKHLLQKTYLALTVGIFKDKSGCIHYPLARSKTFGKFRRAKQEEIADGLKSREAHTQYRVLHEYKNNYSLVEVTPLTGRTHQIRVHFSTIGRPIVGDKVYGSVSDKLDLKRQFLHASRLSFTLNHIHYSFFAPLPQELIAVLQKLAK